MNYKKRGLQRLINNEKIFIDIREIDGNDLNIPLSKLVTFRVILINKQIKYAIYCYFCSLNLNYEAKCFFEYAAWRVITDFQR